MDITEGRAVQIIQQTNGKLFGVEFVTQDLRVRRMACRLNVTKGVKGVIDRQAENKKYGYITVYDFNADKTDDSQGAFRRVNIKTIRTINFQRIHYKVKRDFQNS